MQIHDRLDVAKEMGTWIVHVVSRMYVRVDNIQAGVCRLLYSGRKAGRPSIRS